MSKPVYLDYNATTPVAPEVLAAMGCDANRALVLQITNFETLLASVVMLQN